MSDKKNDKDSKVKNENSNAEFSELASSITDFWTQAAKGASDFAKESTALNLSMMEMAKESLSNPKDPIKVTDLLTDTSAKLVFDQKTMIKAATDYWQNQQSLWAYAIEKSTQGEADPVATPQQGDRRFKNETWDDELFHDLMKQNYLLNSQWMVNLLTSAEGLDEKTRKRVQFFAQQMADSFAPTNFPATNPDVLKQAIESEGKSVLHGIENLRRDINPTDGTLNIRQIDPDAFSVGEDIAATPGSVIFENELMQLIQYAPTTDTVHNRPLLIVPPWINKFYILDLKQHNSFIRWAVDSGLTVFIVSWRNPSAEQADTRFEHYMRHGILDAVDAIEQATGAKTITAIGYCIGGTLLAGTLARMAATGDKRIAAATYFAAQVDFSEPGELSVFIDEEQIDAMDQMMAEKGYFDGAEMARTFNMLRSNDLIWSFWINNYLLGRDPRSFDLLYWNADSTRIPRETHIFYLREMYLNNSLAKPGGITLEGVPIELGDISIQVFLLASKEDHIAPWHSVYKATQLYSGPVKVVLAGSGHIAGVINPPDAEKYQHWTNDENPESPDEWLEGAVEHAGSWWPEWHKWTKKRSGKKVDARMPGSGKLPIIEPAPGRYVMEKT